MPSYLPVHATSPVGSKDHAKAAGFDGGAMEAEAWAYLAVRSALGHPLTFPTTTGCREPVTGGLRAGMGYCGCKDIPSLQREAKLIRVSPQ